MGRQSAAGKGGPRELLPVSCPAPGCGLSAFLRSQKIGKEKKTEKVSGEGNSEQSSPHDGDGLGDSGSSFMDPMPEFAHQ